MTAAALHTAVTCTAATTAVTAACVLHAWHDVLQGEINSVCMRLCKCVCVCVWSTHISLGMNYLQAFTAARVRETPAFAAGKLLHHIMRHELTETDLCV